MAVPIKSKGDEELEMWLNRATDPTNREINWEAVNRFSQQVSKELEGPQIALRLLSHKIHSPQENEALYALAVTEACVRNCGSVFHQELGKFRFLNEIIKILSPKYLGSSSSEAVKKRCTECLYGWSKGLYSEPKIKEAYEMLKKQGIITRDPVYIDQTLKSNPYLPLKREKGNAIFSDEKTAQEISRLLKSKRPEDLMAANRLIKSAVRQDTERMDRLSKRLEELETVRNNAQLLSDMLGQWRPEEATQSDVEVIRELYRTLHDARPKLYRLAGETDTADEESMKEILSVNDLAAEILRRCVGVIGEDQLRESPQQQQQQQQTAGAPAPTATSAASAAAAEAASSSSGLLIGDTAFDPFDPLGYRAPTSSARSSLLTAKPTSGILDLGDLPPSYSSASASTPAANSKSGDIDLLSDLFSTASTVGPPTQQVGITPMLPIKSGIPNRPAQQQAPNLALNPNRPSSGNQIQTATSGGPSAAAPVSKMDTTFQGLDQLGKDFLSRQSPKRIPNAASANSAGALADLLGTTNGKSAESTSIMYDIIMM